MMISRSFALIALFIFAVSVGAQEAIKPVALTGEVVSITDSSIGFKTNEGLVEVKLTEKTEFKRVPPENPSLRAAVDSSKSEIGEGDKLVVTGVLSEDKKTLPARAVYLMTKADIAQAKQAEAQRWAARGMSGRVASVNKDTGQLTVEVRGLVGSQSVTVTPKPGAKFLRYRPDSVQYSDALASKIEDIQAGDMIRVLGDRSSDGLSFAAEELVSGAFRTVAGTIKSVNLETNEILITDLGTETDVTVKIGRNSAMKRFPEEMAMRMAAFGGQSGAGGPQQGQGGQGMGRPAGPPTGVQPGGQTGGQPGPMGAGRPGMANGTRGGIDDMFERFPTIALADLKAGDMIAVSSSRNGNGSGITAIKLLAGVEPFVRAAQMQQAASGGRGRGGAGLGNFTIPGLDGFDFP
ncbi:hypothetical protein [Leptolyngbya sp. 7M]|uniref:hypothetical protein n=1 Tax=Leptolyngbya sp. 7M TaxID=2812896 RepID=UPI001B8C0708|nr:hypothetical protein [Leptolyngbya sp. 7M]QYO67038.1 hypothetical protein JVX88_09625 [Leptolyngbya sp. 7M]